MLNNDILKLFRPFLVCLSFCLPPSISLLLSLRSYQTNIYCFCYLQADEMIAKELARNPQTKLDVQMQIPQINQILLGQIQRHVPGATLDLTKQG